MVDFFWKAIFTQPETDFMEIVYFTGLACWLDET